MQKLTFYCENPPIYDLVQRYGERLEDMAFDSLMTFQAVVATYALYYQFEDGGVEHPKLTFRAAAERVWNGWQQKDPQAYELCKAFCTEEVDGKHLAIPYLVPVLKGLAEAIQCHHDY